MIYPNNEHCVYRETNIEQFFPVQNSLIVQMKKKKCRIGFFTNPVNIVTAEKKVTVIYIEFPKYEYRI